jgi:DNA-binding SARP family transcriptional activator
MVVVQLLGSASITCGEHRIRDSTSRRLAVALYLAAERGRLLDRAATQALLFGDQPEMNAAHSLRQYLYKLGTLGFPIESRRADILVPSDAIRTDVDEILAAERLTPEQLDAIERGVLPDAIAPDLPRYTEWLDEYRARLERELQRAMVRHLGAAREVGDWSAAERIARACLTLDPLNEEATLGLAESLAISGSKAAAVKLLEDYTSEVGLSSGDLKIPANVLRRRIAERLPNVTYRARAELPFVGRKEEMRVLAERLRAARAGESQCVLIHGEPGIGKTRLAAEFANVAVLDGARMVKVAVQPHDVHRPLAALVDLVPLLLQLPGALGCSPESMDALRRLTQRAADEGGFGDLEPEARYHRTTTAIRDLLDAVSSECLLLVIVEDAHWLDVLSLQFIASVAAQRADRRIFLLLTSRERNAVIQYARHADQLTIVHLEPLGVEPSHELASRALLRVAADGPEDLVERIHDSAGGNPLFLTSLAEHWRDAGARYALPRSLSSMIDYQLEHLSTTAVSVLHTAILLGRYSTVARIAGCLEVNPLQLANALQELEERSLLVRDGSLLGSRHRLISDAATNAAPPATLHWLHTCVAGYLEQESRRSGERAMLWDAAEHWIEAGDGESAYSVLLECADAAAAIGRAREACDILARAAELTAQQDRKISALDQALTHAANSAESVRALDLVASLRKLGGSISDEMELFEVAGLMDASRGFATAVNRIDELLRTNSSVEFRAQAAVRLIKIADQSADFPLAARAKQLISSSVEAPRATLLEFNLVYETAFGSLDTALEAAHGLLELTAAWEPAHRLGKWFNIGQVFLLSGRVAESVRLHTDIYDIGMDTGLRRSPLSSALVLASIARDTGKIDDYDSWATRARALIADAPELGGAELLVFEAEDSLFRGNEGDAIARAQELHGIGVASHEPGLVECGSALMIAAKHMGGHRAPAELDALSLDITRLRGIRADDVLVQITGEELILSDRRGEAAALVSKYLEHVRKVRSPLWFGLSQVATQLGLACTDL